MTVSAWLATAVPAAGQVPAPPGDPAPQGVPRLLCEETAISVDRVPCNAPPLTHTFTLKNVGTAPLHFGEVTKPCPCTTYDLPSTTVPPGGETTLTLSVDIREKRGDFWDGIRLVTNDPEKESVFFRFEGFVFDRIDIPNRDIDLGEVAIVDVPSFRYPIPVDVNSPAVPALSEVRSARGVLAGQVDALAPGRFRLVLSFRTSLQEGFFEDTLELRFHGDPIPGLVNHGFTDPATGKPDASTPTPQSELLRVRGFIRGMVLPSQRNLPLSEFLKYSPTERVVYLQYDFPFQVTTVKCEPFMDVKATPLTVRDGRRQIHLQKLTIRIDRDRLPPPARPPSPWTIEVGTDQVNAARVMLFIWDNRE
ncbi:MAG: DUF1573 domain-containing protein [Acidobacteria bacterium]|nr:DUF1573 domain-containing protein [Acidobacteriota bacterium]